MVNDIGKLILLTIGLLSGVAIIILGVVLHDGTSVTVGVGIVGPVVGYMTGNGVLAARGEAPSPAYTPTHEKITDKAISAAAEAIGVDVEAPK